MLAERHHSLAEGVRGLLETSFEAVVMVADKASLYESTRCLQPAVAVVNCPPEAGESFLWLTRLRSLCGGVKVILLSVHDEASFCRSAMEAGVDGFVLKRAIATDLLPAIDAVLGGLTYVSPGIPIDHRV